MGYSRKDSLCSRNRMSHHIKYHTPVRIVNSLYYYRRTIAVIINKNDDSNNNNNNVLCRAFIKSGTLATREPHSLCTGSVKRPDGVTQVPWSRGLCLAWDATCPDTFWAVSHVLASSTSVSSAAATAVAMKSQNYGDITPGVDFFPFAIETSETWGEQAFHLVMKIGRRLATVTTNHVQHRFFVSVCRWQFSAATPSAWRGHFGARTQRSLRWSIEQGLLLLLVVNYFVFSL